MIFDCHMHTEFSSDSKMKIDDVIKISKKYDLGVVITEHTDFNYPDPELFRLNATNYFDTYSQYRSDTLLLGVEIGLSRSINSQNSTFVHSNEFDFVIGSMHGVFDDDIYKVYRNKSISKKDFYSLYFEDMYSCINTFSDFDALGHIDYPCRYMPFDDKELKYKDFQCEIDEIFKLLISKDKIIELNTARLSSKESYKNLLEIYSRYRELGGKYVTIGSDAHVPPQIGRNFKEGLSLLQESNLKTVHFKDRKMIVD